MFANTTVLMPELTQRSTPIAQIAFIGPVRSTMFLILSLAVISAEGVRADEIRVTAPTAELQTEFKLSSFYKKAIVIDGFPIVSSDNVSDFALFEAAFVVNKMLAGRDDVRRALVKNKIRLAIMSPTEFTCDIPEHSDLEPPAYWNRRARGLGPTHARPAVSCGEENLLDLKGDHYQAESILVHEFGHAIHEMGLNSVNPRFDSDLQSIYQQALAEGLWKGTYAGSNYHEYWAEGVQSWFNTNRANDREHNDIDTRAKLKAYDPRLAELLEASFPNNEWSYVKPSIRPEAAHLTGFDRATAPSFVWPAEIVRQFEENEAKKRKSSD